MPERKWTAAQTAAMDIRNRDLLVSAAAGSGKTATLTERIIRRVTDPADPVDVSSLLVVTFTRAAASELKTRIFSALSDALAKNPSDQRLTAQLMKLGGAHICTIDAFYAELVRSHFSELGISASFRTADGAELAVLSEEILEEIVEEFYETHPDFPLLVECFQSTRSQGQLTEVLTSLYEKLRSRLEGLEFLRICAEDYESGTEKDFFHTLYGRILQNETLETVTHLNTVTTEALDMIEGEKMILKYRSAFSGDKQFLDTLQMCLEAEDATYEAVREHLLSYSPASIGNHRIQASEVTEHLAATRKAVKSALEKLAAKSYAKPSALISLTMKDTGGHIRLLYELLTEYDRRMTEEKHRRNLLEFDDIRRYALRLLVTPNGEPTETARAYAEQFTEIYIDEYQDVDRVQDQIFRAISRGNNRFMVGDIKQSIYRFRGAEPSVFSSYRQRFPTCQLEAPYALPHSAEGATVFMSENFRCDRTVIDFTNTVCSYLFSASADSIGYCKEDDLVCSKAYTDDTPKDYTPPKVNMTVILPPEETEEETGTSDEASGMEREARYIAAEIHRLLRTKATMANGKPVRPGDIAVLVRAKKNKAIVAKALRDRGISSSDDDASRYFESADVQLMLCLLNAVDNPRRDIYLAGLLRSPLFGFDMNELYRIRLCGSKAHSLYDALLLCSEGEDELAKRSQCFCRQLSDWRDLARAIPIDRFLRAVFDSEPFLKSGFLTQVSPSGEGGNLLRLYEYARTFESGSFRGLHSFIEFITKVIEQKKDLKIPGQGSSENSVSIMTIHHSKGLEFPVCFVSGMGASFARQEVKESLVLDPSVGIAMKLADGTGFARINTPMREALLANIRRKDTEEEMRVLYVALTRARERLYVTAYANSTEEKLSAKATASAAYHDAYSLFHASGFLTWILTALTANADKSSYELSFLPANLIEGLSPEEEVSPSHTANNIAQPIADPEEVKRLKEAFSFSYPYADFGRIPAKISVSRLSPDVLDENDTSAELFTEKKTDIPDFFLPSAPSRASAAERGTATHLALQFCNIHYAREMGTEAELARLTERRFLPPNVAELIYRDELTRFFEGELAERILTAKAVYREQRFNLLLSPASFTRDADFLARLGDERLAVQGVIDLVFEDREGKLWLVDYKTDRLSAKELASPEAAEKRMNEVHGRQLSYYAKAAELLFGRPCDRLCVYSTHASRLYDIIPRDLKDTEKPWETV